MDIKAKISDIVDFLNENKKYTLIVCLSVITILLLLIIIMIGTGKKSKKIPEPTLILDQKLISPPSPQLPDGYMILRETENKWTEAEIEKWFTQPDKEGIERLETANDRIISDLMEAAP